MPYRSFQIILLVLATTLGPQGPCFAGNEPEADDSLLVFTDGSQLPGTLVGMEGDHTLQWLPSPYSDVPVAVKIESLHRIFQPSQNQIRAGEASLTLTNGDLLLGKLDSIDENTITLSNPAYGQLAIAKDFINNIDIDQHGYFLLNNLGAPADWIRPADNHSNWTIKRNSLHAHKLGTIARELPATNSIHISFDYLYHSSISYLAVHLFADDVNNLNTNSHYTLQFRSDSRSPRNNHSATFIHPRTDANQPLQPNRIRRGLAHQHTQFSLASHTNKFHIEIMANLETNEVVLAINGSEVENWSAPDGLEDPGNLIAFSTDDNASLHINNLKITRWHGSETPYAPKATDASKGMELIKMKNGDIFSGEIRNINEDGLKFISADFGEIILPTENILRIQLPDDALSRKTPRHMQNDIRVRLNQGSSIVFQLLDIKDGKLHGTSETLGDITLPIDQLADIEFNLYIEKSPYLDIPPQSHPTTLMESPWSHGS